jgi:hypothetical protein
MTLGLLQIQIMGSQVKSELAFIFTLYGAIIVKHKSEVERNLINTSLRNFKRLQSKTRIQCQWTDALLADGKLESR